MDDSPLNRLPAELRNKIYESVLTAQGAICFRFSWKDQSWTSDLRFKYGHLLAITKVCRKIRLECDQMVYALNTFEVKIDSIDVRAQLRSFRRHLGQAGADCLRCIIVDVGSLNSEGTLISHQPWTAFIDTDLLNAIRVLQQEADDYSDCDFQVAFLPSRLQDEVPPFMHMHVAVRDLTTSCKNVTTRLRKFIAESPREEVWADLVLVRLCMLRRALEETAV